MTNEFWVFAIVTFLFTLSVNKFVDFVSLRESVEDYLAEVSGHEVIEEEGIVELEEIRDMIIDYVIRNPEIFSQLDNKKDE
tara:strand:- start:471 stop:713 length:243 start_codon:yes stop_codon:yes gene_type:complete